MVHLNAHGEFFTLVCSSELNTTTENVAQNVSKMSFQEPVTVSGLTISRLSGNLKVSCYRRHPNSSTLHVTTLQKQVSRDGNINKFSFLSLPPEKS